MTRAEYWQRRVARCERMANMGLAELLAEQVAAAARRGVALRLGPAGQRLIDSLSFANPAPIRRTITLDDGTRATLH